MSQGMVDFDNTNNSLMFMFFQGVSGHGCDVLAHVFSTTIITALCDLTCMCVY